jgi:hypothetical protein
MPKIEKADRRDEARERARRGMRVSGRSVFTIQRRIGERAAEVTTARPSKLAGQGAPRSGPRNRRGRR